MFKLQEFARNNNANLKSFTYVCLLCKLLCKLGGAKFTARQSCSQGKSACNVFSIYFTDNWQMSQDSEPSKFSRQIDEFWYATSRVEWFPNVETHPTRRILEELGTQLTAAVIISSFASALQVTWKKTEKCLCNMGNWNLY